jgi:hypothetical protein
MVATPLSPAWRSTLSSSNLPIFAGRMGMVDGTMQIRCEGHGVPFTSLSSGRALWEAIRSASQDSGGWLIDPVNGATGPVSSGQEIGRGPEPRLGNTAPKPSELQ